MNTKNVRPFETAKIEIVLLQKEDIIVTSYKPFPGEEDEFETPYYWDQ